MSRPMSWPMPEVIPVFVVDGDVQARRRVLQLLRNDPMVRVAGAFGSISEAVAQSHEPAPRLLLLDERMPERDGFYLLASLVNQGVLPYVILMTARADRSADAFVTGTIDHLLKPFGDDSFAQAIERAKTSILTANAGSLPAMSPQPAPWRARLLLSERGKLVVLPTRDIEFVQAAAKHVRIYAGGRCYAFRQSLSELEGRLDPSSFIRVHRSTLVNIEHLAEMHPLFHGDCELVLRRGTRLTLSRRYRDRLRPFLLE